MSSDTPRKDGLRTVTTDWFAGYNAALLDAKESTDRRLIEARQRKDGPRTEADCEHLAVDYFGLPKGYRGWGLWACAMCKLRFYPACRECVSIGHRSVDHPAEAAAGPRDEPRPSRLDLLAGWDDEDQEQAPRKDGPRTKAGRRLVQQITHGVKPRWMNEHVIAIEAEAAAGPRDNDRDERIRQLVYDHTAHVLGSTDRNGLAISLIEAAGSDAVYLDVHCGGCDGTDRD
jgi:hypothetical protein